MPEPTASSSAHSKVTPGWSEVKVNVASWLSVGSVGEPVIVVSGSGSIVQRWEAGVGSVLAEFTARTSSSCWPTARPVRTYGDSSDSQEPQSSVTPSGRSSPSRLHSKVATESFEENVKLASRLLVPDCGPDSIVVSGGSTVHSWRAGVASTVPAAFFARTSSVWAPASRFSITCRSSQELHDTGSASSEHSKVAAGSLETSSKTAVALTVLAGGPDWIVVSGTAVAVPVAMAKAEKLSTSAQTTPASVSLVVVTSVQAVPSWCSRRTGSAIVS